jgi:hypothetical protein
VSDPLVAVTVTLKVPVGVPVVTSRLTGFEVPPPGAGFVMTTGKVPIVAESPPDGWISTSVELMKVTGRF